MSIRDWFRSERRPETSRSTIPRERENPAHLYQDGMNLFKADRFQEALVVFERLSAIAPSSAAVFFMLGVTHAQLGGQVAKENDSSTPAWLPKSIAAFKRATDLAHRHGGLTDRQRETASEAILHGECVMERQSPSLPEERRRRIFADLMETADAKLVSGMDLGIDMERANRSASPKMMLESIQRNAADASDSAISQVTVRHGVSKGQALAIRDEGCEKKWPRKAVRPEQRGGNLLSAVRSGCKEEVRQLLEAGEDANFVNEDGESLLFVASTSGNSDIVDLLLAAGAEVDYDRGDQVFPIHRAVVGGFTETVRSLIRGGVDVNVASRFGITPLHSASFKGHSEIVKLLLEAGAFVDACDTGDETPLHNAIQNGHSDAAIQLIRGGANVTTTSRGGMSAIFKACAGGLPEVVESLIVAGADVNVRTDAGEAALHEASERGFAEIVERLLEAGADINVTYFEATPLFLASANGQLDVVELLLAAGADVEIPRDGKTPRDAAAEAGHEAVVEALERRSLLRR